MMGVLKSDELEGIIHRFSNELFQKVSGASEYSFNIFVSMIEIYMEKINVITLNRICLI